MIEVNQIKGDSPFSSARNCNLPTAKPQGSQRRLEHGPADGIEDSIGALAVG